MQQHGVEFSNKRIKRPLTECKELLDAFVCYLPFDRTHLFPLSLFRSIAFAPRFSWSRHPSRNMITRAILPFLLLQDGIIHMNVIEHSRQIFMSQQFL